LEDCVELTVLHFERLRGSTLWQCVADVHATIHFSTHCSQNCASDPSLAHNVSGASSLLSSV
jgi:hypothetical protein